MNRSDREITDIKDIKNVLERVKFCTLGVNDSDVPYVFRFLMDTNSAMTAVFSLSIFIVHKKERSLIFGQKAAKHPFLLRQWMV